MAYITRQDEYIAQWRASAYEAVPYTDDFPECLLVLPELIDGAIGQGSASKVNIEVKLSQDNNYLKVTDNGNGVKNVSRLLNWASPQSSTVHHRYGHGSKKCLTKWSKDCLKTTGYVSWRNKTKRSDVSTNLFKYKLPYRGYDPLLIEEDENNETYLMPSGLEWYIEFERKILDHIKTTQLIFYY